jgi:hypothetical protein
MINILESLKRYLVTLLSIRMKITLIMAATTTLFIMRQLVSSKYKTLNRQSSVYVFQGRNIGTVFKMFTLEQCCF